MKNASFFSLDKLGTLGLFLTALLSPCCFPLFAVIASALGLGSFELLGGWTMWIFQGMVALSVAGLALAYRKHRFIYPLALAVVSGVLILYGYHVDESEYWRYFLYAGMAGLLGATGWNHYHSRRAALCACDACSSEAAGKMHLTEPAAKAEVSETYNSTINCPKCGYAQTEVMPTDACLFFYECTSCHAVLRPLPGDCCVFCSFGTVKCPPVTAAKVR